MARIGRTFDLDQERASLSAMERHWREVLASDSQDEASKLRHWKVSLQSMQEKEAALRQQGAWISGRADLLGIINRERRETYHCLILAWLLDPCRPHGLRSSFLGRILNHCFPDEYLTEESLGRAWTVVEEARDRSRADIVIRVGDLTVVVEAKVDAAERPAQCDDLARDFDSDGQVRYVFLSPDRRPPVTQRETGSEWFLLSFWDIARHLADSLALSKNDSPGQATAQSYLTTLYEEFRS